MTRKLLTFSLLVFALNGLSQTQIGNSGMETWTNLGATTEEPTNWNSFLSGQGGLVGFASQQVQRSAIVRAGATGTYSARVWAKSVLGIVANGNMTIGRINMGSSTPTNANNYNISLQADANYSEAITDRPDSIVFWVRYTQGGGGVQNARMHAVLHDAYDLRDPIDAFSTPHVVATAALNYPATAGAWVRKSVPFVYSGAASTVSYILLTFTTNQTPGGGAANDEVLIDDVELIYVPKPSFTPATATVCQGGTVNFTNTSTNYPTSYSWTFPGGSPATSTATNPTVTYNTPGTYSVTLTATNQWGSKTITQTNIITVGSAPASPTVSANGPTSFCSGGSVVLTSSQANGNTWSNSGTSAAITVSTSGTYTVTYTDALGCSATSAPTAVTVNTTPIAPTVSANGPTTFCTGGSVVLTSSQATGNVWSNSAGTGASITVTTSGTYSVTYTDGNGCSATSTPTSVSVSNAPIPTVSASATEVCSGDSIVLTSSVADSYLWNNGGGTTQSITVTNGGSYTVTVTNANACDGAGTSSPITVNILPTPVASATYTVNGNVVTFTNTTSNGTSYSWDFGDQSTSIDASPVHTFAANGTYTVVLIATGGNLVTPCTSETTFTITISGVGLDEQTALTGVVASPNPFTTEVSFEGLTESVEFLLFDMAGKVIAESSMTPESSSVELLNLTSGVYFAHLTTSTGARQIVKLIRK
jgi:PKD repeat protein